MRVTEATKNATRKRILAVAQKQFAEHGFEATTTRDVARSAKIAAGTLFNYFPTKESIVASLVGDASHRVTEEYAGKSAEESKRTVESLSMEEELFGYVAALLRALKPYRKYLPAALETSLSPLAIDGTGETASLRADHLETVGQILSRHSDDERLHRLPFSCIGRCTPACWRSGRRTRRRGKRIRWRSSTGRYRCSSAG